MYYIAIKCFLSLDFLINIKIVITIFLAFTNKFISELVFTI